MFEELDFESLENPEIRKEIKKRLLKELGKENLPALKMIEILSLLHQIKQFEKKEYD